MATHLGSNSSKMFPRLIAFAMFVAIAIFLYVSIFNVYPDAPKVNPFVVVANTTAIEKTIEI